MTFDDERTFKDGIYGLYQRRGLDPDRLLRSIEDEFRTNEKGRWLPELHYVVSGPAKETYPASKGAAPNEAEEPAFTRDLEHEGLTLDDFFHRQPGLGTSDELTKAEVATLRLYTGPVYKPWNDWLRHGDESRTAAKGGQDAVLNTDDWSTSLAVLYNAIIKLSTLSLPGVVYRGVKEERYRLPESFLPHRRLWPNGRADSERDMAQVPPPLLRTSSAGVTPASRDPFAGGVEKAFMSTSRDSVAALRYSGGDEQQGSILQLSFDMGSRGADVRWVSQFPAERELLYPPCTSLTCSAMLTVGKKRVLQVTASVSTNRPNVSWCQEVSDVPPENRPRQPEKLGPFALHSLNFELYTCAVHGGMSVTSRPAAQRLSIREAAKQTLQKSAVWTVEGMRLSPVRPVTLQGAEREQACIQPDATHYAFSYPLEDEDHLQQIEGLVEPTLRALTTVGGFVYFQADAAQTELTLLRVNVFAKSDGRGLTFDGPFSFDAPPGGVPVERAPKEARHGVTLPELLKCGIYHFAWMPEVGAHGAFGYFYANSVNDCFFTLQKVQGDESARFDFGTQASTQRPGGMLAARFKKAVLKIEMAQALGGAGRLSLERTRYSELGLQQHEVEGTEGGKETKHQ